MEDNDGNIDILELYKLAEFTQNHDLIIDTLNIINKISTKTHLNDLNLLYNCYKNDYLKSIIDGLNTLF